MVSRTPCIRTPRAQAPHARAPHARAPDTARRSERARRAILAASMRLVGEVGYTGLTIEAIAARAGVGKQTIYRWWPSKAAVLLDAFTSAAARPEREQGVPDTGDLEADLKRVLRDTADEFADPEFEAPYRALAVAAAADAEVSARIRERLLEPARERYLRRLRSARDAGRIAPDADLPLAVELLTAPFQQRWLQRTGPLTPEFTDALVEQVLRGLAPR